MPRISSKVSKNIPTIYIFYSRHCISIFSPQWELRRKLYLCVITSVCLLRESDTGCHPSALRSDSTPVLCGVTRVCLVAKGLLIKGDMDLELVLMCREKPTKLLLYTISANLPLQIQVRSSHTPSTAVFSTVHPKWALKAQLRKQPWGGKALEKRLCDLIFSRNTCPQRTTEGLYVW